MNIKRNQLRRLIESTLINEFFDDVISTGLDLAVKTADVGLDTAKEVLKNPEAESMMTDLIKAAGADKLGIELFKEMFPKSSVFLAYLKSKNVKSYGLKQLNDHLIVPVYSPATGELRSIQ